MKTTDKQREYFKSRLDYWGQKVCPSIQPRLSKSNTSAEAIAEVVTDLACGCAFVDLDHNAGDVDLKELDKTACHEMAHAMLAPMVVHLESVYNRDYVLSIEHAIIYPLIHTLLEGDK